MMRRDSVMNSNYFLPIITPGVSMNIFALQTHSSIKSLLFKSRTIIPSKDNISHSHTHIESKALIQSRAQSQVQSELQEQSQSQSQSHMLEQKKSKELKLLNKNDLSTEQTLKLNGQCNKYKQSRPKLYKMKPFKVLNFRPKKHINKLEEIQKSIQSLIENRSDSYSLVNLSKRNAHVMIQPDKEVEANKSKLRRLILQEFQTKNNKRTEDPFWQINFNDKRRISRDINQEQKKNLANNLYIQHQENISRTKRYKSNKFTNLSDY